MDRTAKGKDRNLRRPVILLARTLAYIDVRALIAGTHVSFPDLTRSFGETFGFQKSPQTLEEFDLKKGVTFLNGKIGRRPIQKFVIWEGLLAVESNTSTMESTELLNEILNWAVLEFKINFEPDWITHFAYVSDVTFYSDAPLLKFSRAMTDLTSRVTAALSDTWKESLNCEVLGFKIGHDSTIRQFNIAGFTIERRANIKFSENQYFSEAPLPTDLHLELLQNFEKAVS